VSWRSRIHPFRAMASFVFKDENLLAAYKLGTCDACHKQGDKLYAAGEYDSAVAHYVVGANHFAKAQGAAKPSEAVMTRLYAGCCECFLALSQAGAAYGALKDAVKACPTLIEGRVDISKLIWLEGKCLLMKYKDLGERCLRQAHGVMHNGIKLYKQMPAGVPKVEGLHVTVAQLEEILIEVTAELNANREDIPTYDEPAPAPPVAPVAPPPPMVAGDGGYPSFIESGFTEKAAYLDWLKEQQAKEQTGAGAPAA